MLEGEVLEDELLEDIVLEDEVIEDEVTEDVVTAALGLEERHESSCMTYFWSNLGSGWQRAWMSLFSWTSARVSNLLLVTTVSLMLR